MSVVEHKLATSIGWNNESITASNKVVIDSKNVTNLNEDDEKSNQDVLKKFQKERKVANKAQAAAKEAAKLKSKSKKKKDDGEAEPEPVMLGSDGSVALDVIP